MPSMIKYTECHTTFAEIPTEINLCFSISNCSGLCRDCHSPELRSDIGERLLTNVCQEIDKHPGITCVCFLGESLKSKEAKYEWQKIVKTVRTYRPSIKLALYSGRTEVEDWIWNAFDYVKVGPYLPEKGPLNNPHTNQRLYKIDEYGNKTDITYLFWRKHENENNC